ncbi:hypothetical protein CN155_21345 [Sinorhizobium meliloti]|uniref:hypothetical protein n=1 Tax=Rhizobium meliloti TaxID=382 RepID=UPI000FD9D087|nr:hypothetical protein [Sinorhizobium meliloti]RVK52858.1 hypothetical protein CN155_21345 [Sinorhizobium meliloti]
MTDAIDDFLGYYGPCLTTDLSAYLETTFSIKPAAARQKVSRAKDIKRLAYLPFPRNARFVYLQKDFGSDRFWRSLIKALIDTNSAYGAAIAAIRARGGLIPKAHFPIACGAPIQQKKHLSPDTILQRLIQADLVDVRPFDGLGECVTLKQDPQYLAGPVENSRARLFVEEILLGAISTWVRNLGIVSYGKVATRDAVPLPMVGRTAWDLTAPSYLGFLRPAPSPNGGDPNEKSKPGFFVADVLLGSRVDVEGVRPFIRKCQALRGLSRVSPCMQMFVADSYTKDARALLKQHGIIAATPRALFGDEVAEGLRETVHFFRSLAATSRFDPDEFDRIMRVFRRVEGAANQLRGTLLEFMAAEIARRRFGQHVFMNRVYKAPNGKEAEADVISDDGHKRLAFIESKATSAYSTVPDDQFKRWLQHNVPTLFQAVKAHPDWKNRTVRFEFWATASLTAESMALYERTRAELNPDRYSILLRTGNEIMDLCEDIGDDALVQAFEKHFMKK